MTDIRLLDSLDDKNWEIYYIKLCGLDFKSYWTHEEILTKEILESHLDELVDKVLGFIDYVFKPELRPRLPSFDGYWIITMDDIYIGFQILGLLILQTGSYLPDIVRRAILYSTRWEYDKRRGWSELLIKERKENLKKFREAILTYVNGNKIRITF